ncbi:icme protein [Lasius niger]|uniref:Icme protein n=1 Tax=Lasius niger TaxID=67767 RepID=A0A0J7KEX8_LASNI|nr:icme protein [Lasius niger]
MTHKKYFYFASAFLAFSFLTAPLANAQDAGVYAGKVKTAQGAVVGNISQTGDITDVSTGNKIGEVNTNGQVSSPDGTPLGVASNGSKLAAYKIAKNATPGGAQAPVSGGGSYAGDVKDSSGNVIGKISPAGIIIDAATSLPIAKVNVKGKVTDNSGKVLGTAPAGNRLAAFQIAQKSADNRQ